jgi:hypothetical protein
MVKGRVDVTSWMPPHDLRLRHFLNDQTQKEDNGNPEKVRQVAITRLDGAVVETRVAVDGRHVGVAGALDHLPELPGNHGI